MTREEYQGLLENVISEYIDNEEAYNDNAQLTINTDTLELGLVDDDEDIDDKLNQYPVMDLIKMDADGNWQPDKDAIAELAEDYIQ